MREDEIALVDDSYHKDRIANRRLHPETLMMGYGYSPGLSEGSLKPPISIDFRFRERAARQGFF
jgi:methionine-gamma-lyase